MHELYVSPDPCLLVLLLTAWADIEAPGRLLKLAECSKGVPGGRIEVKNARMIRITQIPGQGVLFGFLQAFVSEAVADLTHHISHLGFTLKKNILKK